ncbi:hypothetical protein SAMN05421505_13439 [Sinosporangium album]|uniref:Uncharacterized protein n=1 Tax=Sinosporangium album TaxID=504805 RepID=A0A1G8HWW1_9ACTN|nr:multiple cyclophane-containing RiPP AmcA [Sinosporangium album]SDI11094.1 hypothetical protein SAMN05421505_13439 [Sinosporangium album]
MTVLEFLAATDSDAVRDLIRCHTSGNTVQAPVQAKFDNRPSWDNWAKSPGPFDNRPSWDNWSKK